MSSDLSAPECPPQTVDALGELGSEPTFGELSCPACTCGDHEAPCIVASIYSDPNCTNEIFDIIGPFKGDICTPIAPPNVAPQYWKGHGDYPTTCPVLVDGEVASGPSSFAKKLRFCTSTSAPECTNAACVPNDDTEACIYTDGAAPCPPGFPNKLLAYDGFADQRSCTSCGCQPGLVRCEDPSNDFFVWDTEICGGNLIYQGNGFTPCQEVGLYPSYNLYTYGLNTTTTKGCTPIGGEVQGEITPSLPRTICCR